MPPVSAIIPARARVRRNPPRSMPNQILRVTHGTVGNRRVDVLIDGPLIHIMDLGGAMEVSSDGETWVATNVAYYDNPPLLTLQFPSDISGANRWRVPNVQRWRFDNGRQLVGPFSGSIG